MSGEWISSARVDEVAQQLEQKYQGTVPVFALREVAEWGVRRPEVLALQRQGMVHRVRHGAYCLADSWETSEQDPAYRRKILALSAMVGMRRPIYACGPFAAELHGLPLPSWEPSRVELVRDSCRDIRPAQRGVQPRNRLDGVQIISRNLIGETFSTIDRIPVVGIATAAMTSAVNLPDEYAVALFDAAIQRGWTRDQLMEIGTRWISTKGMASTLRLVEFARAGAESPLESVSRIRFHKQGLPEPILQQEFYDSRGFIGRADMWWPRWRVIGEADGLSKYDDPQVLRNEKLREDRLRALGLSVVRWTWDEIWNNPSDVAARIRAARFQNTHMTRTG